MVLGWIPWCTQGLHKLEKTSGEKRPIFWLYFIEWWRYRSCLVGKLRLHCRTLPWGRWEGNYQKGGAPGSSLAVQWLRLCTSSAGGEGSIPGYGTKIPHAVQHSQKKGEGSKWDKVIPSSQNTGQRCNQPHSNLCSDILVKQLGIRELKKLHQLRWSTQGPSQFLCWESIRGVKLSSSYISPQIHSAHCVPGFRLLLTF